ncbi:response regulator transcription factor [Ichthyenterobacterium magnum]|uniref:Regulatory LuxR family protein n=1 Tax=Ichthyenterobacterium magnum TaxID=1230530 RepID=A0A420DFS5_9FLAO|nr:LuxR C-terminal-related transcriptional regulator [Ichthyenterobacterium magnum]RKE92013.1 regulatory LuxR family protein [Ichthyenterobacterium magnum]
MRIITLIFSLVLLSNTLNAQHVFNGNIDNDRWQNEVYLSVIEDYRKISSIYDEQIISKVSTDSTGFFQFSGNQLNPTNKIYKIHVDNCSTYSQGSNHFEGHCNDSKEILFIAKGNDSIQFPLSFEDEMFCSIQSTNPKTSAFIKIDSLKEDMRFAYSEYRSEANRKLNNKKWFKTLQDYGKNLNEPIAELYIYSFLSDRSNSLHEYYLEDLKNNPYYNNLLIRLKETYPDALYTKQYEAELTSDKYIISTTTKDANIPWHYVLILLLVLSVLGNLYFWLSIKKQKSKKLSVVKEQLTKQEQNILNLLLDSKTNKDIAEALFVSVSTVKTHVNNIYKKLNVQSRDEVKSLFNK